MNGAAFTGFAGAAGSPSWQQYDVSLSRLLAETGERDGGGGGAPLPRGGRTSAPPLLGELTRAFTTGDLVRGVSHRAAARAPGAARFQAKAQNPVRPVRWRLPCAASRVSAPRGVVPRLASARLRRREKPERAAAPFGPPR